MLNKKLLGVVMVAAVAVSSAAVADDRDFNTVAGAVVGAAIGHSTGGRNGAIVGGVIGAAVGNSISTNDRYYNGGNRGGYYQQAPQPVYYQPAPQPVYYQPAPQPVYYAPAPRYYGPPAVIYVQPRGYYHDHGRWEGRGGYGWRR